jgi:hypothetical protein
MMHSGCGQPILFCYSCPTTCHEGAWGEKMYSSYPFLTSALDGGEWSASRPNCGERTSGTDCTGGWVDPGIVWTQTLEEKSFCLCRESSFDWPVVQPVARHYTDWATWLRYYFVINCNSFHKSNSLFSTLYRPYVGNCLINVSSSTSVTVNYTVAFQMEAINSGQNIYFSTVCKLLKCRQ